MKYLFINSVAGGGSTGRLAAETCRELMAQGHQCLIAYGRWKANCDDIPTVRIGSDFDNRVNVLLNRVFDNSGFGTRRATLRFLQQVREYDPDVIWLHNIHGYYIHVGLLFDYLRTCGKQIIWTLHDCWTLTGHCAYFDHVNCEKWKTQCHDCPEKREYPASWICDGSRRNYLLKKKTFRGIPNLRLIVPSRWLKSRVEQGILGEYPVEVRYNQVDRTVFHPCPSDFRKRYGLEQKKILLGVANIWDGRKGLNDFVELAPMLDDSFQIVLVGLTPRQIEKLPKQILGLPRTNNIQQLVEIYSAADLYISTSVDETFGMTVLEAQCCGTPSLVYEGTACEEVTELWGGTAVPRGAENLFKAISAYFQEK